MIINLINEDSAKSQLKILFWKTPPEQRRRKHGRELINTTCQIFLNDGTSGGTLLAMGVAKQNSLDRYNKIVGKKIALTRAINAIPGLRSVGCPTEEGKIRRKSRQQIWAEFHKTFGRWR